MGTAGDLGQAAQTWSILESLSQGHVPSSVTSQEHQGCALPGHMESPGNAVGQGKTAVLGSSVFLHSEELPGESKTLSCHCNLIIHLLRPWKHRVPSLDDLIVT